MRVSVYHNIARDQHDRRIGSFGYQDGHPLVLVFEADIGADDGVTALFMAEQTWTACNLDPGQLTGQMADLARAYRVRHLRSLSVGDIVVIGESSDRIAMRADRAGFSPVPIVALNPLTDPDERRRLTAREPGTRPWPPDAHPIQIPPAGRA
jgi:hypothetical protein